ncbi:hypothetical protein ACEYYH_03870 [Microbacterium trichothecenolyticum]|uniref:hypothetical protein n=1 Tax=Microbacterium trichothecenolyticum TaxID=69370 RepID=UPI0035BEA0F3
MTASTGTQSVRTGASGVISRRRRAMKKALACAVVAIGLVLGSGGAAMAGEVNGNGDDIPAPGKAHSACVFSGQDTEDTVEMNPPGFDDDALAERGNQKHGYKGIQSYGMFVSAGLKDMVPSPGMACNPNGGFEE